jgi:hypoxanthine-guanine phosphoribosyltransferase
LSNEAFIGGILLPVADRIGLLVVDEVHCISDWGHQCKNLDGAFEILENIPETPVLLVDDVIDSGWTMAVLAALLRRAGSGSVYPVALASTSSGD